MKNRGFTLIELIVVLVIIGILVLLATPAFLNYIEIAKLTQIKHDVKVAENIALADYIRTGKIPVGFELLEDENTIIKDIEDGLAYNTIGKINSYDKANGGNKTRVNFHDEGKSEDNNSVNVGKQYYRIPRSFVKGTIGSRLNGEFIINTDMEGIYMDKFVPEDDVEIGDIQLEEDSDFKWEYYKNLELEINSEKFDVFKDSENINAKLSKREIEHIRELYTISSNVHNGSIIKGKLYEFKYDIKEDYKNDHDGNMEIVITGFKDGLKNKPDDIRIPSRIKCSMGHIHDVVGVGDIEKFDSNKKSPFITDNNITFNSLFIPNNIRYIGHQAFELLDLLDIVFENYKNSSLEFIGDGAFSKIVVNNDKKNDGNKCIIKLNLPENTKVIGTSAFGIFNSEENSDITCRTIEIQNLSKLDNLMYLGTLAFTGPNSKFLNNEIIYPKNLIFIGEEVFSYGGDTGTQYEPFDKTGDIDKIKISTNNKMRYIGKRQFFRKMKLERLDIPDNIRYIDRSAFTNYTHGTSSILKPENSDIMKYENYIKYITIGENVEIFESNSSIMNYDAIPYKFNTAYANNNFKKGHYKRILDQSGEKWIWMYSIDGSNFEEILKIGRYEYSSGQ